MHIKISFPGRYRDPNLGQFLGSDFNSRYTFSLNKPGGVADAWFVIEGTNNNDRHCIVPPNRVFFLGAETARRLGSFYSDEKMHLYLNQFSEIHGPQELFENNAFLTFPFLPWMINANHGRDLLKRHVRDIDFFRSLDFLEKTKQFSVICSGRTDSPEHLARFIFVKKLKEHFGDRMDWFGNGVAPIASKWEGLRDYKYSLVLENQASSYALTEKIQDSFLALTFPFYWGAPEASTVFPPGSFLPINLKDFRGAVEIIEQTLKEDPYERSLDSLMVAKRVVTEDLNFLHRIVKLAKASQTEPSSQAVAVELRPVPRDWRDQARWKMKRLGEEFARHLLRR